MKDCEIIDSPGIRGLAQVPPIIAAFFFFASSIVEILAAFLIFNKDELLFSVICIFGFAFSFFLSIFLILYIRRYLVLSDDKIIIFSGFKKREFCVDDTFKIVFAISGTSPLHLSECIFLYKSGKKIYKYNLFSTKNNHKNIEDKFKIFSNKTGCLVEVNWEEAIELRKK